MNTYKIPAKEFDLETTLTCGQTFNWHRIDGNLYEDGKTHFYTFKKGELVEIEKKNDELICQTKLEYGQVENLLGLKHDIESIFEEFPKDENLEKAQEALWGLRILQDEFFPCLISYLCSPQMRIERIKEMRDEIAKKYGGQIERNGRTYYRFPTLEELSKATEDELRNIGVGYRAKYIVETVKIMQDDFPSEKELKEMTYSEAKEELLKLYGVGEKVADCVLLFSLGFLEAYPVDTWADKVLKKHYEDLHSDDYEELSQNMRNYFGEYSGYAQEYLFHAARKNIIDV